MKPRLGIAALLIAVSLSTEAQTKPCSAISDFINQLQKAPLPSSFPDPSGCSGYEPELGKALANFIDKRPSDAAAVVAMVRDAHRQADMKTAYSRVASEVTNELSAHGHRIAMPGNPGDTYALLDTVLTEVASRVPASKPQQPEDSAQKTPTTPLLREIRATHQAVQKSVSDQKMLFGWLMVLATATAFSGLMSGAGLITVLRGKKADEGQTIEARLAPVEDRFKSVADALGDSAASSSKTRQGLIDASDSCMSALKQMRVEAERRHAEIDGMLERLRGLAEEWRSTPPPATNGSLDGAVQLERNVLREAWLGFQKNNELNALIVRADGDEAWRQVCDPLLFGLQKLVPEDLKPTYEMVIAPARDYHNLLRKFAVIPQLLDGKLKALDNEAQELMRTRELAHLLVLTQSSSLIADRLAFHLGPWITDSFIGFADLYLQRYQEARISNGHAALEPGVQIVRTILGAAGIAPVEVRLGETLFDSAQHVGRSVANDARFAEGVIVGIVRNGFIKDGQEVIRQPEVIVNRVR